MRRATVFRRWGDVGALLADAFDAVAADGWSPPDHGTLAADLEALALEVLRGVGPSDALARALIGAADRSEPARAAMHRFLDDRYRRCAVVVDRAVARGGIPAPPDPRRVLVGALGPLYHHLLHLGDAPDEADAVAYARAAARAQPHPG